MDMKRFFGLLLFASTALADPAVSPAPPPGQSSRQASYTSATAASATVAANVTACSTPGGASCTVLLGKTAIKDWRDGTVYIQNTGSNTLSEVLVETSNDGTYWTDVSTGAANNMGAGKQVVVSWSASYTWLRIEGRSASGTTTAIHLSLEH